MFFTIQGKTRPTENELKLKELIRYFVESSVSGAVSIIIIVLYIRMYICTYACVSINIRMYVHISHPKLQLSHLMRTFLCLSSNLKYVQYKYVNVDTCIL